MSWNVYVTDVDPEQVGEVAREKYAAFKANYSDAAEVFPAMDEQFDAALAAAKLLLENEVVGGGNANVTLSGHANPDHQPREGWANDMVNVLVSSAAKPAEPEAEPE